MNKPFFLFAGSTYYPEGGWKDFVSQHATQAKATRAAASLIDKSAEWWQIVNVETGKIVDSYNC